MYYDGLEDTCVVAAPEPVSKEGYVNVNIDGTWLQLDKIKFSGYKKAITSKRGCVDKISLSFTPNILSNFKHRVNRYISIEIQKKDPFINRVDWIKKQYFVSPIQNWQDIGLTLYQDSESPNTSLVFVGDLTGEPFPKPYPYEIAFNTRYIKNHDGSPKITLCLTSQPIKDDLIMRIRIQKAQLPYWKTIFTELFSILKE